MSFVGIGPGDPRFDAAIAYIEAHWQDNNIDPGWGYNTSPAGYQAMYCLMKGLESSGVDEIDTDGVPGLEDWFNQEPTASPSQDFASVLVAQQNVVDGFWPASNWGDKTLCTAWALLTLQKVTVVHHIEVPVDIKPTSCPNPLNLKGKGVLPVAVLGTEDFDVGMIDPDTVVLSREGVEAEVGVLRWDYEDVATPFEGELCDCHDLGADGYIDLTLKFSTAELVEALKLADVAGGTIPLTLTGNLFGGTPISGKDCVWVLKKGKK
jgi:hypothetical protein